MTGTTSYCQGAAASANTLTYDQCTLGGGILNAGVNYTEQWYYNTTGGTSIPGSTAYGGPGGGTSPAGGSGTLNYTPSTATAGTYYYFCYVTWASTGACTPDYTSSAQTITISPSPSALTGTAAICAGQTTTLASTTPGGVWTSTVPGVATVAGGVVTGLTAGTTTISYTVGTCAATRVVTVNALPAITPATPVTICQGNNTTLTASVGGGAWTSSAPGIATVSGGGVVSGISGGTTNITYTVTATGCYATKAVTVDPVATTITGPDIVCLGTPVTYSSGVSGGTWSSSAPGVATVSSSGLVTGVSSGTTTITFTGCGFVTKTITVNPAPGPIAGTLTVCEGGATTTLSNTSTGGTWSSSAPGIATASVSGPGTGLVTGVADGTATITYTSALSCTATAVVTVDPAPDPIMGAIPICVGQSMTVTNAIGGGTWSSAVPAIATVTPAGLVIGMSAGITLISYTNACGTATVAATINALPAPIVGRDTVCVGGTTALANATIGGTWSSSAPPLADVLLSSGLVTGYVPGNVTITYTMPGGCYTTKAVQIEPAAPAITGTMQACPGTTTTLANAIGGGVWTSGSPSIATIHPGTGVVTGVSAGMGDITYTTPAGCPAYTSVLINPLPEPIMGADEIKCAADKDTLFSATPGGTWSSLTPAIATVNPATGVVTVLTGGTAIVRYTLPTGCSVNKTIAVNPAPAPGISYVAATNTFYTDTGYLTYQWYDSLQGLIPGATTYRTAALYYGYYYVKVTNSDDCAGFSIKHPYREFMGTTDPAMGKDRYRIFPNPATTTINIDAPVRVRALVASTEGKVLIAQGDAHEVDISRLAPGLYMVMLYDDAGTQRSVHKLIKQ
ncbi:hypothetical protein GCM10023093_10130 [Nemorincola caseinilytica]|uniref:BIG2 domain-containing protein n=2 Tax=Nemorincola caseinilytica TaxID=2054315 RepID=A0ABP8N7X2_9BACT